MSAILSVDDLNDFISPGVACIKPVETLPKQLPTSANPWEVTTEDSDAFAAQGSPAQISLTDCLACSGCVTSAEAILVSLQSHQEVLNVLDTYPSAIDVNEIRSNDRAKVFVASVSPQARASLAATYGTSEKEAGHMVEQLLSGEQGLKSFGLNGGGFAWVLDTNVFRSISLRASVEELECALSPLSNKSSIKHTDGEIKLPVLASACPGWICYAEKTHPHVLPHISRVKSPQALAGTLLKSVLSRTLQITPDRIWHLAIMPCFDKKLEASRSELRDSSWLPNHESETGVRDVDCVITARELIMLADARNIRFPSLPRRPLSFSRFPDARLNELLFRRHRQRGKENVEAGPSGGYAYSVLQTRQSQLSGSRITINRGRNGDVVEYALVHNDLVVMKTARYFGFRNIQNLVRKLKPQKKSRMPGARLGGAENKRRSNADTAVGSNSGLGDYAYIEVMACPGGCTNGGGQIKFEDVASISGLSQTGKVGVTEQKQWLAKVDEAYFSASADSEDDDESPQVVKTGEDEIVQSIVCHWSSTTRIQRENLLFTTYRQVDSDVGKNQGTSDVERVASLAGSLGGGW